MNIGIWQLVILALVVLVLFGRGRISEMMGDFGKGIKSFKQGMNEEADRPVTAPPRLEQQSQPPMASQPAPAHQPSASAQQQGQMSYDPVSAPPTTDPAPPHVESVGQQPAKRAEPMPFDPVTAPPSSGNGIRRDG